MCVGLATAPFGYPHLDVAPNERTRPVLAVVPLDVPYLMARQSVAGVVAEPHTIAKVNPAGNNNMLATTHVV
jgi:hypothetical protein